MQMKAWRQELRGFRDRRLAVIIVSEPVSGNGAMSPHGPIHTGAYPQLCCTYRHSQERGRMVNHVHTKSTIGSEINRASGGPRSG
ncbi:MAG: hypothetical protein JWQ32_3615, partial [Marmoricola sp.]|nr:hypothetical protein [Marmoricola sp.]